MPVVEGWYVPAGHMEQPSRRDRSDALSTALEMTREYNPNEFDPKWPLALAKLWFVHPYVPSSALFT